MKIRFLQFSYLAILAVCNQCTDVTAAELHIYPGSSFENAVENLNPGDSLTVHEGTYIDAGRISITVRGDHLAPVVIKSANGEQRPLITRSIGAQTQNTINVEGAAYLTIKGLEISGNGGDGITMNGGPSYITLEDLVIRDIAVGINFRSSMDHITVRDNHIHNTSGTGEGMYVGCNNSACAVTESLIEGNWIHNTLAATQGDGIEIKRGSHSNIIRDNVIYDTHFPCILLYGTDGNPRNVVEGNVMWNCGDSGIQAAADTIIRNNIILESPGAAFNSHPHQGVSPQNLEFVHNTVVGGNPCLNLHEWGNKVGLIFANNAVYCGTGSYAIGDLSGVIVRGNVFQPAGAGIPASGYTLGRSEALDFVDINNMQTYPTDDSALLGAGDSDYVTLLDFNGIQRMSRADAGAYTWISSQNPGWLVQGGFKQKSTFPTVLFIAIPTAVAFQDFSALHWAATNVDTCEASGDWDGTKLTAGNQTVGPLEADSTFTLTCSSNSAVNISASVTVTINDSPAKAPTITFSADAASVPFNGSVRLTWSTTDADACDASGAWAGNKPTSGNEAVGPLSSDTTFVLNCIGAGGNVTHDVSVTVQIPDSESRGSESGDGSAFGLIDVLSLVLLSLLGRQSPLQGNRIQVTGQRRTLAERAAKLSSEGRYRAGPAPANRESS